MRAVSDGLARVPVNFPVYFDRFFRVSAQFRHALFYIYAFRQTELRSFLAVFSLRLSCHPISYLGGELSER